MDDAIRQSLEEALLHERNYEEVMTYPGSLVDPPEYEYRCLECFITEYEHSHSCPLRTIVDLLNKEN